MPSDPFYASSEWRACRRDYLKAHGVCATLGCGKRATHVDHIKARRAGGALFDWRNLQGLCHSDHSRKTSRADGGFGNKQGIARQGCDEHGNPLNPSHTWNTPT